MIDGHRRSGCHLSRSFPRIFWNDQDDVKQGDDVRCLYTSTPDPAATQGERGTGSGRERKRERPIAFLSFLSVERVRRKGERQREGERHRQR